MLHMVLWELAMPADKKRRPVVRPAAPDPPTQVGLDAILKDMLSKSPRRVLIYEPNDLVPKRLTPRETRELLQGMRDSVEPVIVTSQFKGSDLILRTLEYLGDRAKPSVPSSPIPSEPNPRRF